MADFERRRFYGGGCNIQAICNGVAAVMLALIPIIGSAFLIAGAGLLTPVFLAVSGASVAAAAVISFYGQAVGWAAKRSVAPAAPAPVKRGGFATLSGLLMAVFVGLPIVIGALIASGSGDIFTGAFAAIVFGSIVAALLIFLYAQATAKAMRRFGHVTRQS